ncbi:hypothetical protein ACPCHQ_11720, partial [Ralstonia thomasii]
MTSERVDQLTAEAEVFYRRLLSVVDDFGRYFANPKLLRSACYPLKDTITAESITRWLDECVRAGLLVVYRDDNKDYLEVDRFGQQVRAKTSKYPNPIAPAGNCLATAKQEQTDGEQVRKHPVNPSCQLGGAGRPAMREQFGDVGRLVGR